MYRLWAATVVIFLAALLAMQVSEARWVCALAFVAMFTLTSVLADLHTVATKTQPPTEACPICKRISAEGVRMIDASALWAAIRQGEEYAQWRTVFEVEYRRFTTPEEPQLPDAPDAEWIEDFKSKHAYEFNPVHWLAYHDLIEEKEGSPGYSGMPEMEKPFWATSKEG